MIKFFKHKKWLASTFCTILVCSVFSASFAIQVSASEINSESSNNTNEDVIKNEKWIEMEKELSIMKIQNRASIQAASLQSENQVSYLLQKYEGAAATTKSGDVGQRIQNGGWNVYYKTKSGKQKARNGYNGMYASWNGTAGGAGVATAWSAATGIGWSAAVIFGSVSATSKYLASLAKTCRDEIDAHGNTGTARMTLTEARWSKKYDNRW